jgi:Uncharacterized protein conserved in archaea
METDRKRQSLTQLLVSVAGEDEVHAAVAGGADIVDVKNPTEGSLGAAEPWRIRNIRNVTPPDVPISVAIGDAPMLPGTMALAALGAACCKIQYVKVGLYGTQNALQAETLLRAVCRSVRESFPTTKIIAAGYADAKKHGAVEPHALPALADRAQADGCMLDTIAKGHAVSLFTLLDQVQLQSFVQECRQLHLISGLAGSLHVADMPRVLALGPDIVGVRSAVCGGDRSNGKVQAQAVAELKALL